MSFADTEKSEVEKVTHPLSWGGRQVVKNTSQAGYRVWRKFHTLAGLGNF